MRKSEQVLAALAAVLGNATDAEFERNAVLPAAVSDDGFVTLRDGSAGEGEPQFSPVAWLYEHRAEVDVVVAGGDDAVRTTRMDVLLVALGAAIAADRTLGGLCDHVEARAPEGSDDLVAGDGAEPLKATTVPIILQYVTSDPLA